MEKWKLRDEPVLSLPGLEINLARRRITSDGREISLTAKEYDIFCLLVANKNRVLTYDQIYEKVWGDFSSGNERETIGFHVRNLRKKLFDSVQEPAYQLRVFEMLAIGFSIIKTILNSSMFQRTITVLILVIITEKIIM